MAERQTIDISPFMTGVLEPGNFPTLDFVGPDWPLTAASLLYCDKIVVSHFSSPTQMNEFIGSDERIRLFERILKTKPEAFKAYRNGTHITECDFTLDEMIVLLSGDYLQWFSDCYKAYKPLSNEQVLLWTPKSLNIESGLGPHNTGDNYSLSDMLIDELCAWDYHQWFSRKGLLSFLTVASSSAVVLGPALMHIRRRLLQCRPYELTKNDQQTKLEWLYKAFQLELFCHFLVTSKRTADVSLTEDVGRTVSEALRFLRATGYKKDVQQATQVNPNQLLAECFAQMPAVKPQAPEIILELRNRYSAELIEFREYLKNLTFDLGEQYKGSPLDVGAAVNRDIVGKFRDLNRKYKVTKKTFWREIGAIGGGGGGLITLAANFHPNWVTIAAAVGVLGSSLLAKSLSQRAKEKEVVETSGVGFLLRCVGANAL